VEAADAAVSRLVADRFGVLEPLLYGRVDVVTLDDGTDVVLEVELVEPAFFLEVDPAAATRFAAEVGRRAETAVIQGGQGAPRRGPGGADRSDPTATEGFGRGEGTLRARGDPWPWPGSKHQGQ
jgi:hypothetical protein